MNNVVTAISILILSPLILLALVGEVVSHPRAQIRHLILLYTKTFLALRYPKVTLLLLLKDHKSRFATHLYLRTRSAVNPINWVSYQELFNWTVNWAHKLPRNYDVVIGVPRAGMIIAGIISLEHNKPLATVDSLIQGKVWLPEELTMPDSLRTVLLVDDTIGRGKAMQPIIQQLKEHNYKVITGSLICSGKRPDYFYKYLLPSTLEWDCADRGSFDMKIATDMDGILCEDCPPELDTDDNKYLQWLNTALPLIIPQCTLNVIISDRLEKYRVATEAWLNHYGIKYNHLELCSFSKVERDSRRGQHKIGVLLRIQPDVMLESNPELARLLQRSTGITTICPWNKWSK